MMGSAFVQPENLSWSAWLSIAVLLSCFFIVTKWISSTVEAILLISFSVGLGLMFFGDFTAWWLGNAGVGILTIVVFYLGFIYKPESWYFRLRQWDVRALFFIMLVL